MNTPNMPNVTQAQILAVGQAVIAVALAFGLSLSESQQTALIGLSGAIAIALPIADAIIRQGRAKMIASQTPPQD